MKKKICLFLALALCAMCMAGCDFSGYDWIDTNYHFDRAIIETPGGGSVEVEVASWADSSDGEQLTITAADGTRYMTSDGKL